MKITNAFLLRFVGCALLTGFLSGCGPNVKGEYSCKGGFLETVRLESGGKAFVSANMFGVKQSKTGTYSVDGEKVVITLDMQPHDFARKGTTLDGGEILGKCTAN
jgi:hypothetical protein